MNNFKSIPDPIIYTAARLESIANQFVFGPMKTSLTSMKILSILKKNGAMNPKEILRLLGGTKSNLSQRLTKLQKNHLLEKTHALRENDKRKIAVRITPAGKNKLREIDQRLKKAHLTLENCFTKKEISTFYNFFEKLNKLLDSRECELCDIFNYPKTKK